MDVLNQFGVVPIDYGVLASQLTDYKSPRQKIVELEKEGSIIRLKRGLYVVSPKISGKLLSIELIANHIYSPSYISKASALRYYGLIPEAVYTMQSMTIKHAKVFENKLGRFEYSFISRNIFSVGITSIEDNGICFLIATPEKSLCDLVASTPKLNLRYIKDVKQYLEYDIRFDMDRFFKLDADIFQAYIDAGGKKKRSIQTLIKFLKR